jgi:flagellar biosynthesis protein
MMHKKLEEKKKAVALSYKETKDEAPKVIAKGQGQIADQILKTAKENHIPIQEDQSLVELLNQLNINETIPNDLYEAVAEIFAFIYKLDQKIN